MKRIYRIYKIYKAGKYSLCKNISQFGYLYNKFYAPLTKEQLKHNSDLDFEIAEAEREHQQYIKDCEEKNKQFVKDNPNNPYAHLYSLPVKSKRMICGIRYST